MITTREGTTSDGEWVCIRREDWLATQKALDAIVGWEEVGIPPITLTELAGIIEERKELRAMTWRRASNGDTEAQEWSARHPPGVRPHVEICLETAE